LTFILERSINNVDANSPKIDFFLPLQEGFLMSKKTYPISRKDEIVVQEVDGEILIYDLRSNKAFCLNETSAAVWRACDGSRDISALNDLVSKQLNNPVNKDLIWLALDQLKKEKLLDRAPEANGRFAGLSRREVVKRIAVGSAVALPIVAGLVAPHAYASASACGAAFMTACDCPNGFMNGDANCGVANCGAPNCICTGPLTGCNPGGNQCMGTCN